MAYPNEVYTAFSFLGFLVCLIPFPCHLRARNSGICLFIFWTGIGCLVSCINSIIWHGNTFNSAPIWCEICTRILLASSYGIPASSLCITRRLYLIQLAAGGHRSHFNKHRAIIFDLFVGLGLPLFSLPIYYISQGHRFNILEDLGCKYTIYDTWVAIVSIFIPPFLIGCVSAAYTTRTLIAINKMRTQIKQIITTHSNMTCSLYFRLMALAGTETLCVIPVTATYMILNSRHVNPWISWEDTHLDFDRIDRYPATIWRAWGSPLPQQMELTRWLYVVCAILVFCFFGLAEEVRTFYGATFRYTCNLIGIYRDRRSDGKLNAFKLDLRPKTSLRDEALFGNVDAISTRTVVSDVEKGGDKWPSSVKDSFSL